MKKTSLFLLFLLLVLFTNAQSDERGYIVKVGDMAPDIEIRYLDGTVKKLSDFKGKVVMLQFTASWCGVCRKEMPYIEKDIWQKHKNNSAFALIGIDLKESAEKTAKFARDLKITYPLTLDTEGESFYAYAAKNAGVTRNIIVDKQGKIVYLTRLYNPREFQEMIRLIEKLLK